MSRRALASIVAAVLVVGLWVAAAIFPVPYVVFSPGPTVNVLGDYGKEPIIQVSGGKSYRDKGELRLLTIAPTGPEQDVNLLSALSAWIDPDRAVYPHDAVYAQDTTVEQAREQNSLEMTTSQDNAIAAAFHALGKKFGKAVEVVSVTKGGPAAGKLKVHDRILSVNGVATSRSEQVSKAVGSLTPGDKVRFEVRRKGKTQPVTIKTTASEADKKKAAVEIRIALGYDFPFEVNLNIDKNIGGPSAGLMFSLAVYDTLTPGSLTDGGVIAGTGEIDEAGKVGPIGGIQQKVVAAQAAGAKLFLSPAANCGEALDGHFDPKKMQLVKVTTMKSALTSIKAWSKDHSADLPGCTQ